MSVHPSETLARFVFSEKHVRADHTVKHNPFLPPSNLRLSVTRHLEFTEPQIWEEGRRVDEERKAHGASGTLYGRADIEAAEVIDSGLLINETPPPPRNHANVEGWPPEKATQMIKAQLLAAKASWKPFM